MSHLFLPTPDGYEAHPLRSEWYQLFAGARNELPRLVALELGSSSPRENLLVRGREQPDASGVQWAFFKGLSQRVVRNGEPIELDLALLDHRDELRVDGCAPIYFSSERLAMIEPCTRLDAPRCPRCAQSIAPGEPAVLCPACGVLYHELPDRNCWTYLPQCAACETASELDAELRWTPEGL